MTIIKSKKKSWFKKPLLFFATIFLLILGLGFWTAKKLPPEAKFLVNHLESEEAMKDIINNQEKYKNLPCFEVDFNNEKYCFDRSRAFFEKKYVNHTTGEDESAVIYFLSKALSHLPPEDREVRVDLTVDKYHGDVNEPEHFVRSAVKENLKEEKIVDKSNNYEFVEITDKLKSERLFKQKHFIFLSKGRIVARFRVGSSNYYKLTGDIIFQLPKDVNYFEIHLVSNQLTEGEFLKILLNVAQEFNQFLSDSKVSNKSL